MLVSIWLHEVLWWVYTEHVVAKRYSSLFLNVAVALTTFFSMVWSKKNVVLALRLNALCSLCDFLAAVISQLAQHPSFFGEYLMRYALSIDRCWLRSSLIVVSLLHNNDFVKRGNFTAHGIMYSLPHLYMSSLNFLVVCCAGIAYITETPICIVSCSDDWISLSSGSDKNFTCKTIQPSSFNGLICNFICILPKSAMFSCV